MSVQAGYHNPTFDEVEPFDKRRPRERVRRAREIPSTAPADTRVWYGWQILMIDAVAIGALGVSDPLDNAPLGLAGGLTYSIGGPIVHLRNGEASTALGSLALRILVPGFGGFVGIAMSNCPRDTGNEESPLIFLSELCPVEGMISGLFAGAIAAAVIDAALLARKDLPDAPSLALVPTVQVTPTGSFFGLTGHF